MEVQEEYQRIKALFADVDEGQLALIDGMILETAKTKIHLNELNVIAAKSGLIKTHPNNPALQKKLPVCDELVKYRASYRDYIKALSSILGRNVTDDDNDLAEFE